MKKLLVFVAAFTVVGQTFSGIRFVNPLEKFFKPSTFQEVVVEKSSNGNALVAEGSDSNAGLVANVKTFQKEALAKADAFISANPKAAVAYTVLATLVLEQVLSFAYDNFIASNDVDEDDEDLDIV